tara:strand:- start:572 stop:2596 length:2025 start_codon:yes stop_codon:yes gene_type:complete
MSINLENIQRWKSYGFNLTPVNPKDKKPVLKDGKWFYEWSDEELLKAVRLGYFHKLSKVFTVDLDDKSYVIHGYMNLLPLSWTDGKVVNFNGYDLAVPTHRTYKINGQGTLKFKYPKVKSKDGGLLAETLTNTQTIFAGEDRLVMNDMEPQEVDLQLLQDRISLMCFFTEVEKLWVKDGQRDEAHLRLAGALARLPEDRFPDDLLVKAVTMLCTHTGDEEVKNRTDKIYYQRDQLHLGKNVYGIKDLSKFLNVKSIPAYDLLKVMEEEPADPKDSDPSDYPLIDGHMFDLQEYPKVEHLMNPILTSRSFNQIFGWYESGKTVFGLALSMAMCSGQDFLGWTCDNKIPTLYVESELPGDIFKSIRSSIRQGYLDEQKEFDAGNHFTLTQDDLTLAGFKYGFKSVAVAKAHGKDAAKDYGRKGREFIQNLLCKIEKRTGQKPFYFLDNMSRLATIDENKQPDWEPFINWGIDWKNKGYAGAFVHHANKGNGDNNKGSSGSSFIGRLLDTSIQLTKLEEDYRFDMKGNKNLQSSIRFDKSRGFGGSKWASKRIITMNEDGQWKEYPYLKQIYFEVLKLHQQGYSQKQIREMAKDQMVVDKYDKAYSSSHVDKMYKELQLLKLISVERESGCWNCKKPISTDADGSCDECGTGIPCSECGKCTRKCEERKIKKRKYND